MTFATQRKATAIIINGTLLTNWVFNENNR